MGVEAHPGLTRSYLVRFEDPRWTTATARVLVQKRSAEVRVHAGMTGPQLDGTEIGSVMMLLLLLLLLLCKGRLTMWSGDPGTGQVNEAVRRE